VKKENHNDFLQIFIQIYPSPKELFKKIKDSIKNLRFTFTSAVLSSIFMHGLLIILLLFSQTSSFLSTMKLKEKNFEAFIQAFGNIKEETLDKDTFEKFFSDMTEERMLKLASKFELNDLNLGKKLKVELFEELLKSYLELPEDKIHINPEINYSIDDALTFLRKESEFELSSGDTVYRWDPLPGKESPRYYQLPKEKKERIDFLRRNEIKEKDYVEISRNRVKVQIETRIKYIPIEYYFRDSPYEEIVARGADLFYIARGFPNLAESSFTYQQTEKSNAFQFVDNKKGFNVIYLKSKLQEQTRLPVQSQQLKKTLAIKHVEFLDLLDDLMKLREEEQFLYFKENYLEEYDPDDRNLAILTSEFIYRNLSNVIINYISISDAFTFIEELFFNKPMDNYFPIFWNENPNTKTGAALLLCLASVYDFEKRGIAYLFSAYKEAKKILSKKYTQTNVFNKKLKAYIIKETFDVLTIELGKKGYILVDEILNKYREEQIRIYKIVKRMGGEERDQALYAEGNLYWDEKNYDLAKQKWKEIDNPDISITFMEIKKVLDNYKNKQKMIQEINSIIHYHSSLDASSQLKRLLGFHRWKNRRNN
jgi:hypothetical protein